MTRHFLMNAQIENRARHKRQFEQAFLLIVQKLSTTYSLVPVAKRFFGRYFGLMSDHFGGSVAAT